MDEHIEDIALFDMDGTLCDYDLAIKAELENLRAPEEPVFLGSIRNAPLYIKRRADIVRKSEEWWATLPRFQLGWDVLGVAKSLDYKIMVLTQGSKTNPAAWSGKKKWIDANLPDTDITITRDKGLVYGKILVDDFPDYIERWLTWRKRGLVVMPANDRNANYSHSQVIRYDGTNLEQVRKVMEIVKIRKAREPLKPIT